MLRELSIRDFVLVTEESLDFHSGFTALTGETGAGKSILLDALGLLLGERGESGLVRVGAARAELTAAFDLIDAPKAAQWLIDQALDGEGEVVLRRVLDAQGKSRAWINGRPATLQQLREVGEMLVDIHGQHAHQSLSRAEVQRDLVDAYGELGETARAVAEAWSARKAARERYASARTAQEKLGLERAELRDRVDELRALNASAEEWAELNATQTRLAHAASLIEAAETSEAELAGDENALLRRLTQLEARLRAELKHDAALADTLELLDNARIQLEEASHALRNYRQRLDLDPSELARVEARLSAIHELARKHRVRPDDLPALQAKSAARLAEIEEASDLAQLEQRVSESEVIYDRCAQMLSAGRQRAAVALGQAVTRAMQELAMAGGALEVALVPNEEGSRFGRESIELRFRAHAQQPAGALSRVASGGELSRLSLAIQAVTAELAQISTLVFDEVDAGIGGAVAGTVGRLLQRLGERRQVICVTHLPQVAACADQQWEVSKMSDGGAARSRLQRLDEKRRVEELARMLGGTEITAKTRAHAAELREQSRRLGS